MRQVKQPLYDQLVDTLKDKIETELEPHESLPSERELVQKYGVSRTTVRQALQELDKLGYIYRVHGKGTFVADLSEKTTNLLSSYSFTQQMIKLGKKPETRVIEFKKMEATKFFANHLQVPIGTPIFKIKRLRLADGIPMMFERTYIPVYLCPELKRERLEEMPLYDIFEKDYHQHINEAHEEFYASIVRMKEAEQLHVVPDAPVLQLVRTTYTDAKEVIEFTLSIARADQFRYKVIHKKQ